MSMFPRSISNGDFKSSGNTVPNTTSNSNQSSNSPTIKISSPTMVSGNTSLTNASGVISVGPTVHVANPEEDNMNLAQLLACFPDPPTNVLNINKQRKDTIYSIVSPPALQSKHSAISDQKLNQIITTDQQSSPDKIIINENYKLERSYSVSHPDETMSDGSSNSSSFSPVLPINISINSKDDLNSTNDSIDSIDQLNLSTSSSNTNNIINKTENNNNNNNNNNNILSPPLSPTHNNNNSINNNIKSTSPGLVSTNNSSSTAYSNHHQSIMINPNQNQNNLNVNSSNNRVTVSFGNFPKSNSSPTISAQSFYQTPKWDVNLNQFQPQSQSAGTLGSPVESQSPILQSQNQPNYELYLKACKNELLPIEFNRVLYSILESKLTDILPILDRCYENLPQSSKDSKESSKEPTKNNFKTSFLTAVKSVVGDDIAFAKLSKIVLFFGVQDRAVPINQEYTDELVIENKSSSKKLRFKLNLGAISKDFVLSVSQKEGTINKKSSLSITMAIQLKTTMKLRKIITVELENGCKYFCILQIESGKTAFGQFIEEEELIDDGGYKIPKTLHSLKRFLVENNGLASESIFRQPPQSNQELYQIKEQISKEPLFKCSDINVVASLIKMYFRELPSCLLSDISHQTFLANEFDSDETLLLVNQISDVKRATFLWLIDLLTDVTKHEATNKMNAKSLSIIFAPNLYVTPLSCSPENSIAVSGKVINFILQMMNLIKNMGN